MDCDPDDRDAPAIVFGTGDGAWQPLECREEVPLGEGVVNGCCHFMGAIEETGLVVDPPVKWSYRVVDEKGIEWAAYGPGSYLRPDDWAPVPGEPGWLSFTSLPIIMSLSTPEDVAGKVLIVTIRVVDDAGVEYIDTHEVIPYDAR